MSKIGWLVAGLVVGAGGGSYLTYRMLKDNYEQQTEEEVAQIRAELLEQSKQYREEKAKKEAEKKPETSPEYNGALDAMKKYGAQDDAKQVLKAEKEPDYPDPYMIPVQTYVLPGNPHTRMGITITSDGKYCDDDHRIISKEDVIKYVGPNIDEYLDESDDDVVYIRNERMKSDYEVLRDPRSYEAIIRGQ